MTTSTTLKLSEQLKARVAQAAASAGKTPHAFMVEAIELQTQLAKRRRQFIGSALAAETAAAPGGRNGSLDLGWTAIPEATSADRAES